MKKKILSYLLLSSLNNPVLSSNYYSNYLDNNSSIEYLNDYSKEFLKNEEEEKNLIDLNIENLSFISSKNYLKNKNSLEKKFKKPIEELIPKIVQKGKNQKSPSFNLYYSVEPEFEFDMDYRDFNFDGWGKGDELLFRFKLKNGDFYFISFINQKNDKILIYDGFNQFAQNGGFDNKENLNFLYNKINLINSYLNQN